MRKHPTLLVVVAVPQGNAHASTRAHDAGHLLLASAAAHGRTNTHLGEGDVEELGDKVADAVMVDEWEGLAVALVVVAGELDPDAEAAVLPLEEADPLCTERIIQHDE